MANQKVEMEPEPRESRALGEAVDARWEVFVADDAERDPQPEPGDFFVERDQAAG